MNLVQYAFLSENGCIDRCGISRSGLPDGAITLPDHIPIAQAGQVMLSGGEWVQRPEINLLVSGSGVMVSECPEGVLFRVYDADSDEHIEDVAPVSGVLLVEITTPGRYRIEAETIPKPFIKPAAILIAV